MPLFNWLRRVFDPEKKKDRPLIPLALIQMVQQTMTHLPAIPGRQTGSAGQSVSGSTGRSRFKPPMSKNTTTIQDLIQEVAAPHTTPERIRQIMQAGGPASDFQTVRNAAATNPNTPLDILAELAHVATDALLTNPSLPFLLLEDPTFFYNLPVSTLKGMLRSTSLPGVVAGSLIYHRDVGIAQAARLHLSIAGELGDDWEVVARKEIQLLPRGDKHILIELAEYGLAPMFILKDLTGSLNAAVRTTIRRTATFTPEMPLYQLLVRASGSEDLSGIADTFDLSLPAEDLERLANGGPYWRHLAARHPNTPVNSLARLVGDSDTFIRLRVARNPSCPVALLERLASGQEAEQLAVSRNPNCPPDLLTQMAASRLPRVRASVARHPKVPTTVLVELATDPEEDVRVAVARHPDTPATVLAQLATEMNLAIQRSLARRAGVPGPAPLEKAPQPLRSATHAPRQPQTITTASAGKPMMAQFLALARDPTARPEALSTLFKDLQVTGWVTGEVAEVLKALAANRNTPPETLAGMVTLYAPAVRLRLASRRELPNGALMRLAGDDNAEVRRAVLRQPRAALLDLKQIAKQTALHQATKAEGTLPRFLAFMHIPPEKSSLRNFRTSAEWPDRLAAALNAEMPEAIRREMAAKDGNVIVRAAARKRLKEPNWRFPME